MKHARFQFTHPGRGATKAFCEEHSLNRVFQFTHPGRGATLRSIYARIHSRVSIHAPREGCDNDGYLTHISRYTFQFTHPGRGATLKRKAFVLTICSSFNSRTPGGVRLASGSLSSSVGMVFQFTHPGRGATHRVGRSLTKATKFQFTHPGRGATALSRSIQPLSCVSIHAPREGCDSKQTASPYTAFCFNSRTPGGVRRSYV